MSFTNAYGMPGVRGFGPVGSNLGNPNSAAGFTGLYELPPPPNFPPPPGGEAGGLLSRFGGMFGGNNGGLGGFIGRGAIALPAFGAGAAMSRSPNPLSQIGGVGLAGAAPVYAVGGAGPGALAGLGLMAQQGGFTAAQSKNPVVQGLGTAAGVTPFLGPLATAGGIAGSIAGKIAPSIKTPLDVARKIPGIGGLFGGGSDQAAAQTVNPQQYNDVALHKTMQPFNLSAENTRAVMDQYNNDINTMRAQLQAGVPITVRTDPKTGQPITGKPSDAQIKQLAFQQAVTQYIPAVQQQQQSDQNMMQQVAASQAAMAPFAQQMMGSSDAAIHNAQVAMGQAPSWLPSDMAQYGQQYANGALANAQQYRDQLANALQLAPALYAQQAVGAQGNALSSRLQSDAISQWIKQNYPQFTSGGNSGGGSLSSLLAGATATGQ